MHLNSELALNLADGTMSRSEKPYWDNHLESCGECAAKLKIWTELIESVARAHLMGAPDDLVASAKEIFRAKKKIREVRASLREIVASVIFDSFAQSAT